MSTELKNHKHCKECGVIIDEPNLYVYCLCPSTAVNELKVKCWKKSLCGKCLLEKLDNKKGGKK